MPAQRHHPEGRLSPNGSSFYYEYTIRDHLGNGRVYFRENGFSASVLQVERSEIPHRRSGKTTTTPSAWSWRQATTPRRQAPKTPTSTTAKSCTKTLGWAGMRMVRGGICRMLGVFRP
ncbi:MAG TPA: hypothetical protein PKC76_19350 [Saprospiraceae bacterium]|nr:hypothetical protein [Saprospiraceae bacterium]